MTRLVGIITVLLMFVALIPRIAGADEKMHGDDIEIILSMSDQRYCIDKPYAITISVVNRSGRAVKVPDPFYEHDKNYWYYIEGPGIAGITNYDYITEGREFYRMRPERPDLEEKLLTIQPNEKVSGEVPISRAIGEDRQGHYRIRAEFDWKGRRLRSNEVVFDLNGSK